MSFDQSLCRLIEAVQTNCHIADARHAADLPLCIYLLQMREFYRWEQRLPFGAPLPRDAVGTWLAAREALWATLEARPFAPLPCAGRAFEAFEVEAVNAWLAPQGLVYGAGLAGPQRPTFFLARLEQSAAREAPGGTLVTLQVCGTEQARSLMAPPAALAGGHTIVLRRQSLARWLWEKFEAHGLRRADGAFERLARVYDLDDADRFNATLPRLLDELGETLVLHEIGEHGAGRWLEPGWAALRWLLRDDRRSELQLRAVRDHLADLAVTIPALIDDGAAAAMHFWFAAYEGPRALLFPSLLPAYESWCAGDGGQALRRAAGRGHAHFSALARELLALHAQHGQSGAARLAERLSAATAVCPA